MSTELPRNVDSIFCLNNIACSFPVYNSLEVLGFGDFFNKEFLRDTKYYFDREKNKY